MSWLPILALGACVWPVERPDGEVLGTLTQGARHGEALAWPEQHVWALPEVARDELLEITVEQRGMDVAVRVESPWVPAVLVDRVPAREGREVLWVPPGERVEWLQVQSQSAGAPDSSYSVTVTSRRPTPVDLQRMEAFASERRAQVAVDTAGAALPAAREAWLAAASGFEGSGDHDFAVRARLEAARVLDIQGHNVLALQEFEALRPTLRPSNRPARARLAYLLGGVLLDLGNIRRAHQELEKAVDEGRGCGDAVGEGKALHNLAVLELDLGHALAAVGLLQRAVRRLEHTRAPNTAVSLMTLGRAHHLLGDAAAALSRFEEALADLIANNLRWDVGRTHVEIGFVQLELRGDAAAAKHHFGQAVSMADEVDDFEGVIAALTGLGAAELDLGNPDAARRAHRRALAAANTVGAPVAITETRTALARSLRAAGRHEDALALIDLALGESTLPGSMVVWARAQRERATLHRLSGAYGPARDDLSGAIDTMEDLRAQIPHPFQRTSFFGTVRPFYEDWIALELEAGDVPAAFRASERGRARTLREAWRAVDRERPVADPALREARRLLEDAQLEAALALEHPQRHAAAQERVAKRYEAYREAESERLLASPRRATLFASEVDLAEVQRALPPDSALVTYVLAEPASTAFVVTPEGLSAHALAGRARIETATLALHRALTARNRATPGRSAKAQQEQLRGADEGVRSAAADLAGLILGPALGDAPPARLWVVPDGALHRIPFGALPAAGGWLVDSTEVARVPAAAALVRQSGALPWRDPRVLVVADPVLREPFAPLPHTAEEARVIAQHGTDVHRLTGLQASAQALQSLSWGEFDVVHFATHGVLDTQHPSQSRLVLSLVDSEGAPVDGFLRVHEILGLGLDADLVTLSACETALGRPVAGEGPLGLTRAFLHAGSDRVLSSLWAVPDQATAELMKRFYQGLLQGGLPPATALRRAQRSLAAEPRWSAPYFWAGFTLEETLISPGTGT